ncbi:MAG: hypothetical protein F9K22_11000 [Bacteroidetes bacterium]|nr:MAG: hypothetical protein F9K22_11000 [Bacteroidota bacterium]
MASKSKASGAAIRNHREDVLKTPPSPLSAHIKKGNSIEQRQSIAVEKMPDGSVSALIVEGTRIQKRKRKDIYDDSDTVYFEMNQSIAKNIHLTDIDFLVEITFTDTEVYGNSIDSIFNGDDNQWNATVTVYQTEDSYKHPICLYAFGREALDAINVKWGDDIFVYSEIDHDDVYIDFIIETQGKTIGELLANTRAEVNAIIPQ